MSDSHVTDDSRLPHQPQQKGRTMRLGRVAVVPVMALIVMAAFLPVVQGNYVYHDDYYDFSVGKSVETHPQYKAYTENYGRPLGIRIKYWYARSMEIARDANLARGVTLCAIALLGLMLYGSVRPYVAGMAEGLLLVAMVITLPPFQTPAAMLANATHIYAALLGGLAGLVMLGVLRDRLWILWRILGAIAAAVMMYYGLQIYQPAVFFYLPVVCFFLLYREFNTLRSLIWRFALAVAPLLVASAAYFVYLQTLPTERAKPAGDIVGKLAWFWQTVLPTVFSFWSLHTTRLWMKVFGVLLAVLAALRIISVWRALRRKEVDQASAGRVLLIDLVRVVGIAALGILSYLPNLAAHEQALYYRTLIAVQPFALLVFYAAARAVIRRIGALLGPADHGIFARGLNFTATAVLLLAACLAAGIGVFTAHYNIMNYYVVPQTIELGYLRQQFSQLDPTRRHHVHIVRPKIPYLVWRNWEDEYGVPSTLFPQDIGHIVAALNREFSMSLPIDTVTNGPSATECDFSPENPSVRTSLPVPKDAVIIDMNGIGLLLDPVQAPRWKKRNVTVHFE